MARRRLLITAVTSVSCPRPRGRGAGRADLGGRCRSGLWWSGRRRARPARTRCPRPAPTSTRTPATAATPASTRTCTWSTTRAANKFLPGNHVVLTDRATQCLTSFSLDFERKSANTADGPDMTVNSVTVNGHAAALHVRPADLPRRPERTGRPQPAGARGLAEQPGRRPGEQPAAPGLLTRASGHRRRRELAERDAVPGQQAGDHAEDPDQGRLGVHREGQLHGQARRAQRRRRHHRGLVPVERRRLRHHRAGGQRGLDAAQRLPDRQADLRLLRHGQRRQDRRWRTACWSR